MKLRIQMVLVMIALGILLAVTVVGFFFGLLAVLCVGEAASALYLAFRSFMVEESGGIPAEN